MLIFEHLMQVCPLYDFFFILYDFFFILCISFFQQESRPAKMQDFMPCLPNLTNSATRAKISLSNSKSNTNRTSTVAEDTSRFSPQRWTRRTCTARALTTSCLAQISAVLAPRRFMSSSTTRARTCSSRRISDAK